jgi:hypothetical protein
MPIFAPKKPKNRPKIINLLLQNSRIYCIFLEKYAEKGSFYGTLTAFCAS